jgi:hypothetical protein
MPSFNKLREELGSDFVSDINGSDWTATCTNGSQIIFFPESLDTDPDLSRWKGLEVNGFILEESDELAEKSYFKAIERAGAWIVPRGGQQPPAFVLCTFNPCANWPKHVFYDPWKNETIAAPYAFIPATQADNPSIGDAQREAWKSLPEAEYKRFVEGDWESLSGRYYDCIDPKAHYVKRDEIPKVLPDWWTYWGAFDWGYAHWSVFGAFAQDSDGNAFLLDSEWMRRGQDSEYAETIRALGVPNGCFRPIYAGHDCWDQALARGGSGVSTFEVFARAGLFLVKADKDLVNGGRALRRALDFKRDEAGKMVKRPQLRIVDTKNNRRVFEQLASIMPDENNINKPAKINSDSEGRGGDDGADMLRYGIASHTPLAIDPQPPAKEWQDRSAVAITADAQLSKRESAEDALNRELRRDGVMNWRATRRPRSGSW